MWWITLSPFIAIAIGFGLAKFLSSKKKAKLTVPEKKSEDSIKNTDKWIGNVVAIYTTKDFGDYKFWFQLFVDDNDNRKVKVTGNTPPFNNAYNHPRYSSVIYPWLNGAHHGFPWSVIDSYDYSWWADNGYTDAPANSVTTQKPKDKPKHDFQLLTFPKPDDKKEEEKQTPDISA